MAFWGGPDVSKFSEQDQALANACRTGNVDLAKQALESGANPSVQFRLALGEITPLFLCATKGYLEIGKLLLEYRANIDKKMDFDGTSCLHHAASNNQPQMCSFFVDKGCKINNQDRLGRTPLMDASEIGSVECIKVLCEKGADVTIEDKEHLIALSYCLDFINHRQMNPNKPKTEETKENKETEKKEKDEKNNTNANANANTSNENKTEKKEEKDEEEKKKDPNDILDKKDILTDAGHMDMSNDKNFYDSAWLLIKHGSNVDTGGKYGNRTFLHYAASKGDLDKCKELIENYEAAYKVFDADGKTPVYYARANGWTEVDTYLTDIQRQNDKACVIL